MKKVTALVLVISIVMALSVTAYAASPRYINKPVMGNSLSISGNTAYMFSEVSANSDVTKIVITHVLQKKVGNGFEDIPSTQKSETFYDYLADKEDSVYCNEAGTYRVKTIFSVTGPKGTDNHTQYSKEKTKH